MGCTDISGACLNAASTTVSGCLSPVCGCSQGLAPQCEEYRGCRQASEAPRPADGSLGEQQVKPHSRAVLHAD